MGGKTDEKPWERGCYNTRQSKNLHLSAPKTNWAKHIITYQAALDFRLSHEIQETESILLFEKNLERMP